MILDAWGWCTGMTQRDGTGREEGGVSGWETRVYLWHIHVDVWQKPTVYCKEIILQLKINKLKLEPIIQSEVSQKEKHQYSIVMHIYGI